MRRTLPLLLLLLAAAGWLLLGSGDPPHRDGDGVERPRAGKYATGGLRREAADETGAAPRPDAHLVGRGDPTTAPGAHGPVRVRVEGPGGIPLPAVVVRAEGSAAGPVAEGTDTRGEVLFPDLPYDGRVTLHFPVPPRFGAGGDTRRVHGPEVVYVAETGLRLRLQVVEAESGRSIRPAGSAVRTKGSVIEPRRLEEGVFLVAPSVGRSAALEAEVEPPPGWLAWDPAQVGTAISPYATELLCVYPLRRERTAWVAVAEADGRPANAVVSRVRAAGRDLPASHIRRDAYDRIQIGGIPHLPGEPLRVTARTAEPDFVGSATVALPITDDAHADLLVRVTLPRLVHVADLPAFQVSTIGIGGGAGGAYGGRRGWRLNLNRAEAGAVTVTVRRRDGSPAVNALVRVGGRTARTDARGARAWAA